MTYVYRLMEATGEKVVEGTQDKSVVCIQFRRKSACVREQNICWTLFLIVSYYRMMAMKVSKCNLDLPT